VQGHYGAGTEIRVVLNLGEVAHLILDLRRRYLMTLRGYTHSSRFAACIPEVHMPDEERTVFCFTCNA
jgi:hypothetical protein